MLKRILIAALWLPLAALAQSYPSPTFNNLTVLGNASISGALTVTGGNSIGLGALAQQAANTVLANATGSTANVTAFSMPSCSTSASALNWTSGTGFTCNSAVNAAQLGGNASSFYATSGANSNITSLTGLSTPLSVSQGGTGRATLTSHGVLVGESTSAINQTSPGTTGQVLVGSTSADPAFGTTVAGLTFTSAITPSTTAGIVGTTAGDNANAGSVGEYVSASFSAVSMTNGVLTNLASISLSAGDWDVQGNAIFATSGASANMTTVICGVSTTSATLPALGQYDQLSGIAVPTTSGASVICPITRLSLTTTTTVYAIGDTLFSAGTVQAAGFIRARRVR